MGVNDHLHNAAWTVADQGVVSFGNFVISIFLARALSASEFGTYVLIFSGLISLQLINTSLILLPLSVRIPAAGIDRRRHLLAISISLVAVACLPECLFLSIVLLVLGREDLIAATAAWFALWQMQEAARRGLFSVFRHRAAIIGDAISYLGQLLVVAGLSLYQELTLAGVLYSVAATSGLAALLQLRQLGLKLNLGRLSSEFRPIIKDYWYVGRWALVNGLVITVRDKFLLWQLAAIAGASLAGTYGAVIGVINLANPIMLGLSNIIPQTAAHLQNRGNAYAWRSARMYAYLGVVPTFTYYAVLLIIPTIVLRIFYGADSPYLEASDATRILAVAAMIGYGSEVICAFLQGANASRFVLVTNLWMTATILLLAVPLTKEFGLSGSFLALAIANVARLVTSTRLLSKMIGAKCLPEQQSFGTS